VREETSLHTLGNPLADGDEGAETKRRKK
jgi:hypothetical protein